MTISDVFVDNSIEATRLRLMIRFGSCTTDAAVLHLRFKGATWLHQTNPE